MCCSMSVEFEVITENDIREMKASESVNAFTRCSFAFREKTI